MRKKILMIIITTVFGCAVLSGCKKNVGTPEDNAVVEEDEDGDSEGEDPGTEGALFGYSCINLGNPYYEVLKDSIKTELDAKGGRILVKDPAGDADLQVQQIQEMIEEEVDAVFLCPVDWETITPALEALDEAGIPVINVDTQVKETSLTDAYVGSDNKNAGKVCADDLKEQMPEGGKIAILECPSQNSVNERITGFEEGIRNQGFEVAAREDASGERAAAKEKMLQILKADSDIDAVMCGNDQMALGAMDAAEELGRNDIRIYGVDGSPEMKNEIMQGNPLVKGTAAQSPINLGKKAADIGIAIVSAGDYEEETYIETFFINRENVEMYGTDGWQ